MSANPETSDQSRLFERFIDPVDMIACFPADTSLREINQTVSKHGLYFPLFCDPERSLRDHINALEYTSASARFGAYVDNIPGMNWILPGGQVARIGERVVKSTTGYDLLRYLLHTNERFGSASDYVIRLRPLSPEAYYFTLTGSAKALRAISESIVKSTWSHWIDCCDAVTDSNSTQIELSGHCLQDEGVKFRKYFENLTQQHDAEISTSAANTAGEIPSFMIKTIPSQMEVISRQCLEALGGRSRQLLVNGVVLAYPETPPNRDWLARAHETAAQHGGHLHSINSQTTTSNQNEATWVESILQSWKQI